MCDRVGRGRWREERREWTGIDRGVRVWVRVTRVRVTRVRVTRVRVWVGIESRNEGRYWDGCRIRDGRSTTPRP